MKTYYVPVWLQQKIGIKGFNSNEILNESDSAYCIIDESTKEPIWIAKSVLLDTEDEN